MRSGSHLPLRRDPGLLGAPFVHAVQRERQCKLDGLALRRTRRWPRLERGRWGFRRDLQGGGPSSSNARAVTRSALPSALSDAGESPRVAGNTAVPGGAGFVSETVKRVQPNDSPESALETRTSTLRIGNCEDITTRKPVGGVVEHAAASAASATAQTAGAARRFTERSVPASAPATGSGCP